MSAAIIGDGEVVANGVTFRYLEAGPADGPLALCLHGFPDHAPTWRHLLPELAAAGYHAVAPWMRGYAPTGPAPIGSGYRIDELAADVNALHAELGGTADAVLIGHDWGALATYRAAAAEPDRWRRIVTLSIPPEPALRSLPTDPRQLLCRSWYILGFQFPGAIHVAKARDLALIDLLWRRWSPGYIRQPDDLAPLHATLAASLGNAIGYYRAQRRGWVTAAMTGHTIVPPQPTLYVHGEDDGCMGVSYARDSLRHLAAGSRVEILPLVGHFVHLEAPETVARLILDFLDGSRGGPLTGS